MAVETFPVSPETCTVNGYRVKASSPAWAGLDFEHASVREQASILLFVMGNEAPFDLHLSAPWLDPDDTDREEDGCFYRVRPIARAGKKWNGRKVESVSIRPAPEMTPPWAIEVYLDPA